MIAKDTDKETSGSVKDRLAMREVCDFSNTMQLKKNPAGWEEKGWNCFLSRWTGQLGVLAGDIRRAGICDIGGKSNSRWAIRGDRITTGLASSNEGAVAPEKIPLEWYRREVSIVQGREDSQLRKGQWKPPRGSRKRQRNRNKTYRTLWFSSLWRRKQRGRCSVRMGWSNYLVRRFPGRRTWGGEKREMEARIINNTGI